MSTSLACIWHLAHGVRVACSAADAGDLRDADRRATWCRSHGIPLPSVCRQVHGTAIHPAPVAQTPDGDGLVSTGEPIGVFGADCPPLVVAAPDALGAAHCGWRGTAAGIVPALIARMHERSRIPSKHWQALVGPGIHPDDYEVDAPVLSARTWPAGSLRPGRSRHAWLDLPAAICADLAAAGVHDCARCPRSTSRDAALRSHRRDGRGHPQLIVAWRAACAP